MSKNIRKLKTHKSTYKSTQNQQKSPKIKHNTNFNKFQNFIVFISALTIFQLPRQVSPRIQPRIVNGAVVDASSNIAPWIVQLMICETERGREHRVERWGSGLIYVKITIRDFRDFILKIWYLTVREMFIQTQKTPRMATD